MARMKPGSFVANRDDGGQSAIDNPVTGITALQIHFL